jgi:hypothetical protein
VWQRGGPVGLRRGGLLGGLDAVLLGHGLRVRLLALGAGAAVELLDAVLAAVQQQGVAGLDDVVPSGAPRYTLPRWMPSTTTPSSRRVSSPSVRPASQSESSTSSSATA